MTEWVHTVLGDVADISIGRTPSRDEPAYWTSDLSNPFCSIADMHDQIVHPRREGITQAAIDAGKAKRFPAGALMMSFKLSIGRLGFAGCDLYPNEAIARFETDARTLLESYLALVLEGQDLTLGAGRAVKGNTLNRASLKQIPVSFPKDLAVQQRIVALMNSVNSAVAASAHEAARLDGLLGSLRARMAASFDIRPIDDVLAFAKSGGTPSRSNPAFYGGGIPWLKSGEVSSPWITETEETVSDGGLAGSSAWLVPAQSVVVAMYGATASEVGFLGAPMATNQAVLALGVDEVQADARFLYHWLCSQSSRLKLLATGAAQPNLSKGLILSHVGFPFATPDEQRSWASTLDAVVAAHERASEALDAMRATRQRLLIAFVSGEVEADEAVDRFFDTEQAVA